MSSLTHFDENGAARMVDVGGKESTTRTAIAEGYVRMQAETLQLILRGGHKKGDVLGVARVAGIMACKKTWELIPLCHPIPITGVDLRFEVELEQNRIRCETRVRTVAPTGVEMEALTATQIALLTIYDMCKAVDRGMSIETVRLLEKLGGKSGYWRRDSAD